MNIMIVAKLSNEMLNNLVLKPLLNVSFIDHIFILRDTKGIEDKKITYITCNKSNYKSKIRHALKIYNGIKYCKMHNIKVIIGILIYPHGLIGQIISFVARVAYVHMTIAGHREFWLFGKVVETLMLFLFRRSKFILVTGSKTRDYLIHNEYLESKLKVFPNVIDMKKFFPTEYSRNIDIISLSRLDKNKNVSLLLRAIAKMKDYSKVKIIIAGVGPELNNLIEESKKLGISDNVNFTGWIEENKKVDTYNSGRIYVLCSRGEGFPLSLLEAMACGCIPVVSNVGDVSDIIINGINGFLINNLENEEELTNILNNLLNNYNLYKTILKESIKVRDTHNIDNNIELWTKMLSEIK